MSMHDPPPMTLDEEIMCWLRKRPLLGIVSVASALLTVFFLNWGSGIGLPGEKVALSTQDVAPEISIALPITASNTTPAVLPAATLLSVSAGFASDVTASPAPVITRLLFTGDINPGRCPAQVAKIADNFLFPYQYVAEELSSADLTIGSLDGSITDLVPPTPCIESYNLVGPSRTVNGLAYAGFDVLSVATNHALDCGILGWRCDGKAMEDTRRFLLSVNIQPVGDGDTPLMARSPVILERNGIHFAFLAVNAISGDATWATSSRPGTAPLSDDTIQDLVADIQNAHTLADVVIVLPHWGVEYKEIPEDSQRRWAAQMIAAGADLVIGNHPHVAQPVQTFPGGGVVAYALGNFVFDQAPVDTNQSVVFEADFLGPELVSWRLLPVRINNKFQPIWATSNEAAAILDRIAEASQNLMVR